MNLVQYQFQQVSNASHANIQVSVGQTGSNGFAGFDTNMMNTGAGLPDQTPMNDSMSHIQAKAFLDETRGDVGAVHQASIPHHPTAPSRSSDYRLPMPLYSTSALRKSECRQAFPGHNTTQNPIISQPQAPAHLALHDRHKIWQGPGAPFHQLHTSRMAATPPPMQTSAGRHDIRQEVNRCPLPTPPPTRASSTFKVHQKEIQPLMFSGAEYCSRLAQHKLQRETAIRERMAGVSESGLVGCPELLVAVPMSGRAPRTGYITTASYTSASAALVQHRSDPQSQYASVHTPSPTNSSVSESSSSPSPFHPESILQSSSAESLDQGTVGTSAPVAPIEPQGTPHSITPTPIQGRAIRDKVSQSCDQCSRAKKKCSGPRNGADCEPCLAKQKRCAWSPKGVIKKSESKEEMDFVKNCQETSSKASRESSPAHTPIRNKVKTKKRKASDQSSPDETETLPKAKVMRLDTAKALCPDPISTPDSASEATVMGSMHSYQQDSTTTPLPEVRVNTASPNQMFATANPVLGPADTDILQADPIERVNNPMAQLVMPFGSDFEHNFDFALQDPVQQFGMDFGHEFTFTAPPEIPSPYAHELYANQGVESTNFETPVRKESVVWPEIFQALEGGLQAPAAVYPAPPTVTAAPAVEMPTMYNTAELVMPQSSGMFAEEHIEHPMHFDWTQTSAPQNAGEYFKSDGSGMTVECHLQWANHMIATGQLDL